MCHSVTKLNGLNLPQRKWQQCKCQLEMLVEIKDILMMMVANINTPNKIRKTLTKPISTSTPIALYYQYSKGKTVQTIKSKINEQTV